MDDSSPMNQNRYLEDDITELMEEDVWGHDDDISSIEFSSSSRQWPDSESDSHFSSYHDDGSLNRSSSFSSSQFSPAARNDGEMVHSQQSNSMHVLVSKRAASMDAKGMKHSTGTMPCQNRLASAITNSPRDGPRSVPIEVPSLSRIDMQADDDNVEKDHISGFKRKPPHVLLAEQFSRSQGPAFSVMEGAGRTLKGRDAREVRNAVWKQTGFPG
ncbi:hypothetical protein KP509_01G065200 [Ceratopteris richardii]|uniref:Senescence regulator n=1 Tax=Ceratopteris richardii TaxID=49495 RepID=A0A8T2VQ92_CERRI|nr:hypothetical protein KP509_01G065200 [Ceratopteris richardii]